MTKRMDLANQQTETKTGQQLRSAAKKPVVQSPVTHLQNHLGNAAIQRLLAQRSGDGAFDLDDESATRINHARSNGQALDKTIQTQMSQSMDADFSNVRVHTDGEAHQLNEQLSAKAFTTGQDIFFRKGEYNPGSSSGQELIAHELTHVVQQGTGVVDDGGNTMHVNAPGDQFEQEADSVAKTVTSGAATPAVQRADLSKEEVQNPLLQRQEEEEKPVGIQEEDKNLMQLQELPEDERKDVV